MTLRNAFCVIMLAVVGWCGVGANAASVAVDAAAENQTIEGFGAFGGINSDEWSQNFIDMIIGDLGVSAIRTNTGDAGESVEEWCSYMTAAKNKADQLGQQLRFIASTWSPPAYMKVNNSVSGENASTNKLKPEYYDDYGGVVRDYIQDVKDRTGIEYYAVSFQNEPAFAEPYWSCVYTAEEYRDMVKAAGPVVRAAFPSMRFFGAEDMLARWTATGSFLGPLMVDPDSKALMYALAVHGYTDGVHPTPTSDMVSKWKTAARNCASVNRPLWMTETSGYESNWDGAFKLAEAIYAALKHGKLALWTWWSMSTSSGDAYALMQRENPTKKYYTSKHFYRYIRPGAVMIDATSDDELVFSVAFHHKEKNTLTVVLLNANSGSVSVDITGSDLPTFSRYLTTSSLNCANQGSTGATGIQLPGNSVTTLYGENYEPSDVAVRLTDTRTHAAGRDAAVLMRELYSLQGRRVVGRNTSDAVAGIVVQRTVFRDGSVRYSPIPGSR